MARIQIELPEQFNFSTDITLYGSHMNYGGHLDNALLLTVVSEARVRFFANGTSDEMTLVLSSGGEYRKITLEVTTALASAGNVR